MTVSQSESKRVISKQRLASSLGIPFRETSATSRLDCDATIKEVLLDWYIGLQASGVGTKDCDLFNYMSSAIATSCLIVCEYSLSTNCYDHINGRY